MIKTKGKWWRVRMTMMFTFIVFINMLTTMTLITFGLFVFGKLDRVTGSAGRGFLLVLVIGSLTLGTFLAAIFSRIPLRPVREIIAATNKLAKGEFDTRIQLRGLDEFIGLSESFNHMAEELGGIEMLRSDFVNNFSHEFKTPIVSVRGFAKVLKRDDLTKAERDEFLDIIIDESDRLAKLATNVLNLSKIENQAILTGKTYFNISEQIRRVIALLENSWSKKHLEIAFDCGEIYLSGNEELLSQVFINLIDNAIKFSPDFGQIDIQVCEGDGGVSISIADQGEGMSAETAAHVFDKFYQGDTSHSTPGNGIGLTLAKKIAELHGGNIAITRSDGNGSVFKVQLPE